MLFSFRKPSIPVLSFAGLLVAGTAFLGCSSDDPAGPAVDSNALVVLTNPQGGETFKVGQTVQIKWTTPKEDVDFPVDAVDIEFSWNNGQYWKALNLASITKQDAEWGNYPWTIPATISYSGLPVTLAGTTQGLLRVRQYSTSDSVQRSTLKNTFSITAATP
jgi:hypothetical protein